MSKLYSATVATPADWDAVIEAHCLPRETEAIEGISMTERFEDMTSEQIASLSEWYRENGTTILLDIQSPELCEHILGQREVNPATEAFNWTRGKGQEKVYVMLDNNQHNRIQTQSNLGDMNKEGLTFDVNQGYMALGPVGHVDAVGCVVSLAHRLKAPLIVYDDTGEFKGFQILVQIGVPPQLCAVFDRNAPKTGNDQEFMDRNQFTIEFMRSILDEKMPEDPMKVRNVLCKYLVTVQNNLWSRLHGTGYHPSKKQQPSKRQARKMQACFAPSEFASATEDQLQELIVKVYNRSVTDDGKKAHWSNYISVPMATCQIILASNADNGEWNDGDPIAVDFDLADTILTALGESSAEGNVGYSSFLREIGVVKKEPKKPAGLDRWIYWGFTSATAQILADEYDPSESYFPKVNKTLIKAVKDGKQSAPILGGYDCGPRVEDEGDED